ncbi:MAG: hypothetical protein WBA12_01190 [Catalinimonas sp.]
MCLQRIEILAYAAVGRLTRGGGWWWRVALCAGVLTLCVATPSFEWVGGSEALSRVDSKLRRTGLVYPTYTREALRQQIEAPLTPQEHQPHMHAAKLELRLTMPLLAWTFGLKLHHLFALQFMGGFGLFALAALLIYRAAGDRIVAALLAFALACVPPGTAAFNDSVGYFTGIALLLLLTAMWSRAPLVVGLCVPAAAFTDERAAVASGFVLLWWVWHDVIERGGSLKAKHAGRIAAVVLGGIVYAGLRFRLAERYGLRTPVGPDAYVGTSVLFGDCWHVLPGVFFALEALWLFLLPAIWVGLRRYGAFGWAFGGMVVVQIAVAASVYSHTRSAAYLLPALFIATAVLTKVVSARELRVLMLVAFGLCLIVPTISIIQRYAYPSVSLPVRLFGWYVKASGRPVPDL